MAIARGAGTEIIRTHLFEDVNNAVSVLIQGVQHHVYTVLSIVCYCNSRSGSENGSLRLIGFDAKGYTSAATHKIVTTSVAADGTFVWNDKFSFNGYEPTGVSSPLNTAAEQDAIADQGGSVVQYLTFQTDSSSTTYDLIVTFIDQNNE